MSYRNPLNRALAPMIIRLFDTCFRHGVIDACNADDDFVVREFVSKHQYAGSFGIIGDELEYDWQMFRFTLYRWARENHLRRLAEEYIIFVRRTDYLWPLLPYCMWFYILGAKEWLEYPSKQNMGLFLTRNKRHWSPNSSSKVFVMQDYVSYMHEAAYDYRRVPEDKRLVSTMLVDSFCMAIYDLCQKKLSGRNG